MVSVSMTQNDPIHGGVFFVLFPQAPERKQISPVNPGDPGNDSKRKEIADSVYDPRLVNPIIVFSSERKTLAKIKKDSCLAVINEDLVSTDFVGSTVERDGGL